MEPRPVNLISCALGPVLLHKMEPLDQLCSRTCPPSYLEHPNHTVTPDQDLYQDSRTCPLHTCSSLITQAPPDQPYLGLSSSMEPLVCCTTTYVAEVPRNTPLHFHGPQSHHFVQQMSDLHPFSDFRPLKQRCVVVGIREKWLLLT